MNSERDPEMLDEYDFSGGVRVKANGVETFKGQVGIHYGYKQIGASLWQPF